MPPEDLDFGDAVQPRLHMIFLNFEFSIFLQIAMQVYRLLVYW